MNIYINIGMGVEGGADILKLPIRSLKIYQ